MTSILRVLLYVILAGAAVVPTRILGAPSSAAFPVFPVSIGFMGTQESSVTRETADRAFREGRYADAIRQYEVLTKAEPDDWQLAFRLAHSFHMAGDYRGSIEAHRRVAEFEQPRPVAFYNMACAHSMLGEVEPALAALDRALAEGFENLEQLGTDADLEAVRRTPRFAEIRRKYENPGQSQGLTWDGLAERMKAEEAAGFSGSLLVVRDGRVVLSEGYGMADREKEIPCRADTVFAIGSVPIDFTHVGILLLAQRGEIDLSDPITFFFPDVPEDKQGITLGHLMSGRSGMEDFHDLPEDPDPDHTYIDRDEAIERILSKPLLFAPGTDERHSHSAWGVLAAVCEVVSGMTYPEFVRSEIFEPAGMEDTGFHGEAVPTQRLAIGYGQRTDGEVNAPPFWGPTSWLVMGSGGQISTTGDLDRFQRALREGRILEPEWARRYFGDGDGAGVAAAGNAYGFEVRYTQGPSSRMILITNGGLGSRSFRQLSDDLAALVDGTAPPVTRKHAALDELPWSDLNELLERFRAEVDLPALAAAVTRDGEIVASAAVGRRRADRPEPVTVGDRFHWGSVGKSVTGTMLGRLIQDGVLSPDDTVGEAFPELDVHPGFRDVTLRQLMAHRGGVPPFTNLSGPIEASSSDPIAARTAFLAGLLSQPPEGTPGVTQDYSNAGIALAANFAERRTGKTWEELVREHVFTPAGMRAAGHGWPEDLGDDQPHGHQRRQGRFVVASGMPGDHWRALDAAGNVHGSIEDLARHGLVHLNGLNGREGYLHPETVVDLHDPLRGPGEPYAYGWGIDTWPPKSEYESHWHNGSGGTYYALIRLVPELDLGISILMNAYDRNLEQLAEELSMALYRRYGEER